MAGFQRLYVIGGRGGFQGADGVNPIEILILVGQSDREWLEPHYIDKRIKPLGKLRSIIPEEPNDPHALLDACIAFYPKHFETCPSLDAVRSQLGDTEVLDFNLRKDAVPQEWKRLRQEARSLAVNLNIWIADLEPVSIY